MANVMVDGSNNMWTWGANGLGQFMNPNLLSTPGVSQAWEQRGLIKPLGPAGGQQAMSMSAGGGNNPFSAAMSGNQKGTLQPYINRMTGNANNALYAGLLGYQPQQLIAGNAGGTPEHPQAPQFSLPPGLLSGMGQRHWMK